ncbi:MAG: hypothetical protein AAFP76_10495 [Bacteroidota bacterium]
MKRFLTLVALSVVIMAGAQNDEAYVDELTSDFTQKLTERGIDQYFVAKRYCSGKIEMFQIGREKKLCTSRGTYYEVYVVWKEEEIVRLKKMDNCGLFYSLELVNEVLYDLFDSRKSALKSEEVKHYKSASYTGEPELRKKPQPCFRAFQFTYGSEQYSKSYNLFDLSNEVEGDNLNYDHNQKLTVVQLDRHLDEILSTSEAQLRRQL